MLFVFSCVCVNGVYVQLCMCEWCLCSAVYVCMVFVFSCVCVNGVYVQLCMCVNGVYVQLCMCECRLCSARCEYQVNSSDARHARRPQQILLT